MNFGAEITLPQHLRNSSLKPEVTLSSPKLYLIMAGIFVIAIAILYACTNFRITMKLFQHILTVFSSVVPLVQYLAKRKYVIEGIYSLPFYRIGDTVQLGVLDNKGVLADMKISGKVISFLVKKKKVKGKPEFEEPIEVTKTASKFGTVYSVKIVLPDDAELVAAPKNKFQYSYFIVLEGEKLSMKYPIMADPDVKIG